MFVCWILHMFLMLNGNHPIFFLLCLVVFLKHFLCLYMCKINCENMERMHLCLWEIFILLY